MSNTKTTQITLLDKKRVASTAQRPKESGNNTFRNKVFQTDRKQSANKIKNIIGYGAKK